MSGFFTKRRLAAALCAAVLCLFSAMALADEATPTKPDVFTISATPTEQGVTVTVSNAQERAITAVLSKDSSPCGLSGNRTGNGSISISIAESGNYSVVAYYDEFPEVKTASVDFTYTKQEPQTAGAISADVSVEGQIISVTVTQADAGRQLSITAGGEPVIASLNETKTFGPLSAGEYTVTVNYEQEPKLATPFSAPATIAAPPAVTPTAFTISASAAEDGTVSVTVKGAAALTLEAKLIDKATGAQVGDTATCTGDGTLTLGKPGAGEYTVVVNYATPAEGISAQNADVTVAAQGGGTGGGINPPAVAPTAFTISAGAAEDGTVSVTVTGAAALELEAKLLNKGTTEPALATATRTGDGVLTLGQPGAGEYTVVVNYATPAEGISAQTADVTVAAQGGGPSEPQLPQVMSMRTVPSAPGGSTGSIEGSITFTGDKKMVVKLYNAENVQVSEVILDPSGDKKFAFTGLAAGNYRIDFHYWGGSDPALSLTYTVQEQLPTATAIVATASVGVERIDVSVTTATAIPVTVTLKQGDTEVSKKEIAAGMGTVAFEGLAAGTYSLSIDYTTKQTGVEPTLIGSLNVVAKRAAITDMAAVGGENELSITGRAQPGSDVTLTTEPASVTAIVHVDEKGSFTTTITCAAGTYTAVNAQYGTETDTRVTLKGTFVVTPPAVRPTLEVDPIANNTLTVVARTTPGVKVNLSTSDYAQTVTADASGLMRYSLPHTYATGTVVTFTVKYGKDNAQSYQQTVTVGEPRYYSLLKRGSYGSAVRELTQRLSDLGYPVSVTSSYGDSVAAAVRLFQQANGLSADGMAGQATQAALYSLAAVPYGGGEEYPTLVRGDRGLALIYTLQQRLKDLGYYSIRVDGIYGSGTQRAVRWFQQVNGLTATGAADSVTQKLLYSSAAKPASGWSGGSYVTLSRSGYYDARVVTLQRRLKALGYLSGSADGYFGTKTYRAVRSFQSRNGLSVTGVADPYTQEVLYSSSAKAASGSSSSSTGYRLLYWGCRGDAVRRLQQALLNAGYKQVRTADGIYGQWTYDAVRAFQKDHGLAVDGIAGKNTQNALYGTSY